MNKTNFCWTQI